MSFYNLCKIKGVTLYYNQLTKGQVLFLVEEVESLNVVEALQTRTEIGEEDVLLRLTGTHVRKVREERHVRHGPAARVCLRLSVRRADHLHLEVHRHPLGRGLLVLDRLRLQQEGREWLLDWLEAVHCQGRVTGGQSDFSLGSAKRGNLKNTVY